MKNRVCTDLHGLAPTFRMNGKLALSYRRHTGKSVQLGAVYAKRGLC